jgi:flagellar L-ring protein precursor FlgH
MKKISFIIILLFLSLSLNAKSLWKQANSSMFSDRKAINPGDIVTIIIEEASMAKSSNSTASGKELTIGGEAGTNQDANSKSDETVFNSIAKMIPLFGATATGASDYKKNAQDARSTSLNAKIAVVVDNIDENGNLILKGERIVKINNQEQKMVLSGLCRIDDVGSDNVISSTKIADAKITFNGSVDFSDGKRKGFFTRAWNGIWNFLF